MVGNRLVYLRLAEALDPLALKAPFTPVGKARDDVGALLLVPAAPLHPDVCARLQRLHDIGDELLKGRRIERVDRKLRREAGADRAAIAGKLHERCHVIIDQRGERRNLRHRRAMRPRFPATNRLLPEAEFGCERRLGKAERSASLDDLRGESAVTLRNLIELCHPHTVSECDPGCNSFNVCDQS